MWYFKYICQGSSKKPLFYQFSMTLSCFYEIYDSSSASKLLPCSVSLSLGHGVLSLLNMVVSWRRIVFGGKSHSEFPGRLAHGTFVEVEFELWVTKVSCCWTWTQLVAGSGHVFLHSFSILTVFSAKYCGSLLRTLDPMVWSGLDIEEISSAS